MGLKGIISVSGLPGLYKVLAQSKTGFIVESLVDQKRMPVSSTQKISMLEDISVYTTTDDMPLKEVLLKIKEKEASGKIVDSKAEPDKLRAFFKEIIPEFDEERVYPSDMKKMINWFHLVKDIVDVEDEKDEDEVKGEESETTTEEPVTTDADAKDEPVKKKSKPKAKEEIKADKGGAKTAKSKKQKETK
jgi:hypothetical protein